MLKKKLNEKFSASIRPVVYILLSAISLKLASRPRQTHLTPWSPIPMVEKQSRVHQFENYLPSLLRFLDRREIRLNKEKLHKEKLLLQHISKLSDHDRLNQHDLFYIMKLSKSLSEIEKLYFKKCFYAVREKVQMSIENGNEFQTHIYAEKIVKPKALSQSAIITSVFFHVLMTHSKNAQMKTEPICSMTDNISEATVEIICKDGENFQRVVDEKFGEITLTPEASEFLRSFSQKIHKSKFPYDKIFYTESKTGEEE
jgi:hypothetical protein